MTPEEAREIIRTGMARLIDLDPATPPLFGRMTAFEMVEHLMHSLNLTFVEKELPLTTPTDKVGKAQAFLASNHMIRPGAEQPEFYNSLPPTSTLKEDWVYRVNECKALLLKMTSELDSSNDQWMKGHPVFGRLTRDQWWLFQGKHFYHHLSQFGIFPRTEIWEGLSA